ncbi:MAG: tetratricopeptide repeat protein [Planctomycetota bacterium]
MASNSANDSATFETHEEIPESVRTRLEQFIQFGKDKQKVDDYGYAHSMFSQCVVKDPSNLGYVEMMLANLQTQFEGQKKKCKVRENRGPFKKAISEANDAVKNDDLEKAEKKWRKVLKLGPGLLKDNPWDVPTLRGMADACAFFRFNEVELRYLKNALEGNSKDIEVNKHCATSLARMGQFDQAIACWHRIEDKVKKEALKMISDLTVAKTQYRSGNIDEEGLARLLNVVPIAKAPSAAKRMAAAAAAAAESADESETEEEKPPAPKARAMAKPVDDTPKQLTKEDLEKLIANRPEEVENYLSLAELHTKAGEYREAEQVLRRALPVSGGDLKVHEQLEKAQVKRSKAYLVRAEKKAKDEPSEEATEQVEKIRRQHLRLELDIFNARADRYPDDPKLKYEIGVRLKKFGNFEEAAKYFKEAEVDQDCKSAALLNHGECLQQMRQYTAALQSYERASEVTPSSNSGEQEVQRLALYRAGVLAVGLKDTERAKRWLKKLVEIAPNYRDAASRLDKLG